MKKLILISILLSLVGCAWLGKQYDYVQLCATDPACLSEAKKDSDTLKAIAGSAFPLAAIPAGVLAFVVSAWVRGKKKK